MKTNVSFYTRWVKWDIILRLIFGPLIFLSPVVVTVINLILDGFDGEMFKRSGYARPQYSIYDKLLDYWWYVWILIYILITDAPAKYLFIFLFGYRTIGQVLFLAYNKGIILFVFPNIYELIFFYYLIAKIIHQEQTFMSGSNLIIATIVLSTIAFAREIIIHLKKMNFSGVYLGKTTYWPIRTINPYKAFVFFTLLLSFTFLLNQFISNRTTQTYTTQAKRAQKNGTMISYDASGILTGMVLTHTDVAAVTLVKIIQSKQTTVCRTINLPLLKTNFTQNGILKEVFVFTYRDSCLRSIPDGNYGLFISDKDQTNSEQLIEFGIYHGQLQK